MNQIERIKKMSDREVIDALHDGTALSRAAIEFSNSAAAIEQASAQRESLSPIERRRMELIAAAKIMALFVPVS